MTKLPPAADWQARDIDDWNTSTFTHYLQAKHRELFDIDYAPMRSWQMEQGTLGGLIGTKTKPRTVSNEIVKAFIDDAFATYRPTADYPGTNFGFIYAYRRNILQRLQAESNAEKQREQSREDAPDLDELSAWF